MPYNFKYIPVFRSRQQELLILSGFDFQDRMYPLVEVIKAKDRTNNVRTPADIWRGYISDAHAERVLVDLPVYLRDSSAMTDEVLAFNRTTLSNIEQRIAFFQTLAPLGAKVIPVLSSLLLKTGEAGTLTQQVTALRAHFPQVAIRTFTATLDIDFDEISALLTNEDILIYDLDTAQPLNPLVKLQQRRIATLAAPYKVAVRSAINTEIQNIKLDHGGVVADADNSLLELFAPVLHMNAFGDYAGIKKDELNSGGTISPGFIFYDPIDNLYYGYKGEVKELSEFETTIVPAVLNSGVVQQLRDQYPEYLNGNPGYQQLLAIADGATGKSQAKFKRIAMEHYLHCIRIKIQAGQLG